MRTPALSILVVAGLAMVPAAAPAASSCSGSFDPQGNAGGGFYAHIVAGGVGCTTARKTVRGWVVKASKRQPVPRTLVVGSFTCTTPGIETTAVDTDGTVRVRCVASGRRVVRFSGHP